MQEASDLLLLIQLGAFLFEATNTHHRAQQRQQVLSAHMRLYCVGVVHADGSAIKIGLPIVSPTGGCSSALIQVNHPLHPTIAEFVKCGSRRGMPKATTCH